LLLTLTLLAYFVLILSSIAWKLCLPKSSGATWTRSAILVWRTVSKDTRQGGLMNLAEDEDKGGEGGMVQLTRMNISGWNTEISIWVLKLWLKRDMRTDRFLVNLIKKV